MFEKSDENLRTSLLAIMQMVPKDRHRFYASENGREIVKGLFLEAEQNKKTRADGTNWTEEDIQRTIYALRNASEDDFKIFLQLMPSPVAYRVSEHFKKERQLNPISKSKSIDKGAKIGTAGYELWLAKRRQHNKVSMEDGDDKPMKTGAKTPKPTTPPAPAKPSAVKPKSYKRFVAKKPLAPKK
jgi:hypothetical protein